MPGSVVGVKTPQSEGCLSICINGVKKQPERVSVGTASGRRNSTCKGPGLGLRNSEDAKVARGQ